MMLALVLDRIGVGIGVAAIAGAAAAAAWVTVSNDAVEAICCCCCMDTMVDVAAIELVRAASSEAIAPCRVVLAEAMRLACSCNWALASASCMLL